MPPIVCPLEASAKILAASSQRRHRGFLPSDPRATGRGGRVSASREDPFVNRYVTIFLAPGARIGESVVQSTHRTRPCRRSKPVGLWFTRIGKTRRKGTVAEEDSRDSGDGATRASTGTCSPWSVLPERLRWPVDGAGEIPLSAQEIFRPDVGGKDKGGTAPRAPLAVVKTARGIFLGNA